MNSGLYLFFRLGKYLKLILITYYDIIYNYLNLLLIFHHLYPFFTLIKLYKYFIVLQGMFHILRIFSNYLFLIFLLCRYFEKF